MKITKKILERIIQEELEKITEEEMNYAQLAADLGDDNLSGILRGEKSSIDPTAALNAGSSTEEIVSALKAIAKEVYR